METAEPAEEPPKEMAVHYYYCQCLFFSLLLNMSTIMIIITINVTIASPGFRWFTCGFRGLGV